METIAVWAGLALLAVVVVLVIRQMRFYWQRAVVEGRTGLMQRMFARQGVDPGAAVDAGMVREAVEAVHRCVACEREEDCIVFLESGQREGFERFCPNAEYMKKLKAASADKGIARPA